MHEGKVVYHPQICLFWDSDYFKLFLSKKQKKVKRSLLPSPYLPKGICIEKSDPRRELLTQITIF